MNKADTDLPFEEIIYSPYRSDNAKEWMADEQTIEAIKNEVWSEGTEHEETSKDLMEEAFSFDFLYDITKGTYNE